MILDSNKTVNGIQNPLIREQLILFIITEIMCFSFGILTSCASTYLDSQFNGYKK